ncbi:MAG TPA: BamA/TamA family outer membrane protein [Gemmatimonadales bacterium]|nr:BamA/TamA family outer membrane protein [Gemmatimonadales bacterium]
MRLLSAGMLLLLVSPLSAQDSVIVIDPNAPASDTVVRGGPPPEVIAELIALFNDSASTRIQGDVTFPAGSQFEGSLALYRGALRIAGRINGPVTVVNGTLYLMPGASVQGEILVVGGRLIRSEQVEHFGRERVYWDAAPVVRTTEGWLALRERRRSLTELATATTSFQVGRVRTTLSLGTGGTYNRVEGLPLHFGPLFELRPSRRTYARIDLRGILRTAGSGDDRSDFGYVARLDFRVQGRPEYGISGRLYSQIDPFEDQPLSSSESGWSAFLLQRDYRDLFEREGAGGTVYIQPNQSWRFELSMSRDAQRSLRISDPWSLLRNSDRWRRNPLVDDGHYFTTGLQLDFDTRNDRNRPTTGWMIRTRFEHYTSDDIAPVALPASVRPTPATGGGYGTGRLSIDARRYARLTPQLQLNARVRADGWIEGDRLPVQRRVSLGGPDLLPGFDFRAFTCAPRGFNDSAKPALCDRMVAVQLEVRTRLGLNLGYRMPGRDGMPGRFIGIEEADLVFFGDAGKAWLAGSGPGQVPVNRLPVLKEWDFDAGAGLDAGGIGAYLAKSLSESEPVKFVVRLQRRF